MTLMAWAVSILVYIDTASVTKSLALGGTGFRLASSSCRAAVLDVGRDEWLELL